MTPGEWQAMAERVGEALARARDLAGHSAEARATAAELTVIADANCSCARAECERAQELARECLRCHHTDTVAVHLWAGRPAQALNQLSPSRTQTAAAIPQSSSPLASAAAVSTSATRDQRPVRRRV
jgi:hypothetical protein